MVWLTNKKTGARFNTDWLDKERQIKANQTEQKQTENSKAGWETEKESKVIAQQLIDQAHKEEPQVMKDLNASVNAGSGHLEGLKYRFKGEGSLSEKLVRKSLEKGISVQDYAKKVTDVLRFTNQSDAEHLASDFHTVKAELEKRGHKMIECTNTFKEGESYKGINTLVKSPSGYTYELQFHTKQSLEIKEINHKLYEESRKVGTSKERKDALNLEMARNADSVIHPRNIDSVKDIK